MAAREWPRRRLDAIHQRGLTRVGELIFPEAAADRQRGKPLDFCSNDYLALANDARLVQTLQTAAARYGIGSGGSPLICGYSNAHRQLEQHICELTGRSRALLFSSGYLANLALVTTLAADRNANVIMDKHNHASLIDAGRLTAARLQRYRHLQTTDLARLLQTAAPGALVVTESVFSMSGVVADIAGAARLCQQHDAVLAVDDAHGFGVLGDNGAGTVAQLGLSEQQVPLIIATLGKAAGVHGAFIAGDRDLVELILQQGRSYIYSTALPAALAATADKALQLLAQEDWRRQTLRQLIALFRRGAAERGLTILPSDTPVQALLLPGNEQVMQAGRFLAEQGIRTGVIRSPTVAAGTERLRISLNAAHTPEQLQRLLDELHRFCAAQ
ncbi:MAG: aminotransferase class I/II-fold pyridoxal phosphate-dependent enzyme [Gammaproteobacteria bacterium]